MIAGGLVVRALLTLLVALGGACIPRNPNVRVFEDPFAGRTRSFETFLDAGRVAAVRGTRTRASTVLEVTVVAEGAVRASAPAETVVAFQLADRVVNVPTDANAAPTGGSQQDGTAVTQWRLPMSPNRGQAEALANGQIRSFRVEIGGSPRTTTLTAEVTRVLQQNLLTLVFDD